MFVEALTRPGCASPGEPPEGIEVVLTEPAENLRLRGWYSPSQNGAAVVALGGIHGALGERLPLVQPLVEAGYGVLQVDSRAWKPRWSKPAWTS